MSNSQKTPKLPKLQYVKLKITKEAKIAENAKIAKIAENAKAAQNPETYTLDPPKKRFPKSSGELFPYNTREGFKDMKVFYFGSANISTLMLLTVA